MAFIHSILTPLLPYSYLILVLSILLIGEEALLLFVIFAGQGFISLTKVLAIGLPLILAADITIFYLSRKIVHHKIKRWKKILNVSNNVRKFAHKMHTNNALLILTLRRFLLGTRHAVTVYSGIKKMPSTKFIIQNTVSLILWSLVMVPLAWLAGRGFAEILKITTRFEKLVSLAILFLLVIVLLERGLTRLTKSN